MSWWRNASTEQRLAQIDGGIECGLTIRQIALASGITKNAVSVFASYHKRHLPAQNRILSASKARSNQIKRERTDFIRGNAVDFWSHEAPQPTDELQEVSF